MKTKILTAVINLFLCAVLVFTASVGLSSVKTTQVSADYKNLFYGANIDTDGVCLTFNVYERTDNVYKILNVLESFRAKATFFIGGCWADDNVDCVREIYSRGHELGSHGYFHRSHDKMSTLQNLREIEPSVRLINAICLNDVKLFAPPSGAFNDNTLIACERLNLKVIMWSRDTIDWRDKDASIIFERATKNLQFGEFILMHPTDATVIALENILKYLADNGIRTYTISQCIGE